MFVFDNEYLQNLIFEKKSRIMYFKNNFFLFYDRKVANDLRPKRLVDSFLN
jgi:hypothetical protein